MRGKDFLKVGTILATGVPSWGSRAGQRSSPETGSINKPIDFLNDGMPLSPHEYADLLMRLADEGKIKPDYYSNGGVIEELEEWNSVCWRWKRTGSKQKTGGSRPGLASL
jgi:threonine aldolase